MQKVFRIQINSQRRLKTYQKGLIQQVINNNKKYKNRTTNKYLKNKSIQQKTIYNIYKMSKHM